MTAYRRRGSIPETMLRGGSVNPGSSGSSTTGTRLIGVSPPGYALRTVSLVRLLDVPESTTRPVWSTSPVGDGERLGASVREADRHALGVDVLDDAKICWIRGDRPTTARRGAPGGAVISARPMASILLLAARQQPFWVDRSADSGIM